MGSLRPLLVYGLLSLVVAAACDTAGGDGSNDVQILDIVGTGDAAAVDTRVVPDLAGDDAGPAPDVAVHDLGIADTPADPDVSGHDASDRDVFHGVFDVPVPDLACPGDAGETLALCMAPPVHYCRSWDAVGGSIRVALRWVSSLPALCDLEMRHGDGEPVRFGYEGSDTPLTEHAFDYQITMYDFWEGPPAVGTVFSWTAVCTLAGDDTEVRSEAAAVTLTQAGRDCIWQFDDECSDGSAILCRLMLPLCDAGLVPALIESCGHCVYPATCTCDDGSELVCDVPPPECGSDTVLAVQGGCHDCVSPWTCRAPTLR